MTGLIRAETERHDIVRSSKVTTTSLASGTGSEESNELGNLNKKSVRKKSRGVYLPIG